MYYSGPDLFEVFHHTAVAPLAHLKYTGDRGEGWYTIGQSGCLVSVDGPFATEQEARDSRVVEVPLTVGDRITRRRLPGAE